MAPTHMQAARFYGTKDLRVEQVELPPLKAGEVRVKVAFAGICGRSVYYRTSSVCFSADRRALQ